MCSRLIAFHGLLKDSNVNETRTKIKPLGIVGMRECATNRCPSVVRRCWKRWWKAASHKLLVPTLMSVETALTYRDFTLVVKQ
jgi:hypothetical protein